MAIILAVALCTALNAVTIAVLVDAIVSSGPGLSANATQVITSGLAGVVGLLGGYIGYKAGLAAGSGPADPQQKGQEGNQGDNPDLDQ